MEKNEIKKSLYREKPMANLLMIRLGVAYYETSVNDGYIVNFEVPIEDMGNADFMPVMDGKLLNRWIKND